MVTASYCSFLIDIYYVGQMNEWCPTRLCTFAFYHEETSAWLKPPLFKLYTNSLFSALFQLV